MYMESIDVGKLRENFIVKPNDNNDNKFKSLIVAERDPLKGKWNKQVKAIYQKYVRGGLDIAEIGETQD